MTNDFYPCDWKEIARDIKASAGYICQECGRQCRRPGEMYLGWEYEMHVAHYDQVYSAPEVFCVALCAPCHFLHDCRHAWLARWRWERVRRWQAGQAMLDLKFQ